MNQPVVSVLRALDVLACFAETERPQTTSDVAVATCLSRGTVHRLLHTLVQSGYLVQLNGSFVLTPHVRKLGAGFLATDPLGLVAQPVLEGLTADTGLHSAVAILDGHDVVCVAAAPAVGPLALSTKIGSRLPAGSTSLGRVLLGELIDGHVCVEGEFDPQLRSLGVPILATGQRLVGSLALVSSDPAVSLVELERLVLEAAQVAAAQIAVNV